MKARGCLLGQRLRESAEEGLSFFKKRPFPIPGLGGRARGACSWRREGGKMIKPDDLLVLLS